MDSAGRCLVSIVSLWEIALLMNLGRIERLPGLFELPAGIEALPVTPAHCQALLDLPQSTGTRSTVCSSPRHRSNA